MCLKKSPRDLVEDQLSKAKLNEDLSSSSEEEEEEYCIGGEDEVEVKVSSHDK